jgi:hypothetical protein
MDAIERAALRRWDNAGQYPGMGTWTDERFHELKIQPLMQNKWREYSTKQGLPWSQQA